MSVFHWTHGAAATARSGGSGCPALTRWHTLSASFIAYTGVGIDMYAIYSPLLKSQLNLTQGQLETIGVAGALVNLVGLSSVPGLLADKYGPRVAVTGAMVFYGSGLWLFWATLSGLLPSHPSTIVLQLSACKVLSGWGSEWPSAGLLPLTVKNFPDAPTYALATFKCMVSLSGAIVTLFYQGFLAPNALDFLLFIAVAAPLLMLIGLPFLAAHPLPASATATATKKRIGATYACVITLMVVITADALIDGVFSGLSQPTKQATAVAVLTIAVASESGVFRHRSL